MTSFLSIGLFVSCLCVCIYRVSAGTAPPSPPDDVRLQQCDSRRAHITWKPGNDNGSPITRYYVEYNTSYAPTNWFKATTVPADVTEATVQTSPFANYTFRVVAQNRESESQPSQPTLRVCMTNPDTPYKNPRHVHTDRSKPGFLIVKWDPMPEIEQNGPGFRYIVTTRIDGMSETMVITDWRQNQMEINYHRIYYPVEIKVEAANALGNSVQPAPVIIGYTGEDYPNVIPSNFELVPGKEMTATSAWFQWDPVDPSPEAMRGEFHGYKIRIWKGDARDTNYREVLIPRAPSRGLGTSHGNPEIENEMAVVQNLYPHSVVHVDIVAVNTYYASLPSNPVTIQTPEGVPGPVEFVRILVRGKHLLILEWSRPKEPNGIIIGYEISFKETHGLHSGHFHLLQLNDPSQTRALLDGLTPNRQYRIYVRALTKAGKGEQYFIEATTAEQGHYVDPDTKCNSSIAGPEPGEIASHGTPCYYSIQAGEGKLIELELVEIDFGSRTCEQESIEVLKGLLGEGRPLVTLCTNASPGLIGVRESAFFIAYQTGPDLSGSGFRMKYRFIPENSAVIPEITHFPVDVTSDKGETVEFHCSGDASDPSVRWSWKKHDGTLDTERMQILANHTLRIENVEASDAGMYICTAENVLGSDEAVARLKVEHSELHCGDGLQGMTFTSGDSSQQLEFTTENSLSSMDFKGDYKFACDCDGGKMICAPMTFKFGWK